MAERRRGTKKHAGKPAPVREGPIRLNRFLSMAGVASRRQADKIIASGRVSVNGEPVRELGTKVDESDTVHVDGKPVSPQSLVYVLLNKPKDAITTKDDENNRRTVMDLITMDKKTKSGIFPVGRLDRDTTGLLLLTNDGELAHRLMHPSYEVEKIYKLTTERNVSSDELDKLRTGIELDDGPAKADHAMFIEGDQKKVGLQIHEGRNRQVRRMFEQLGHTVLHLERTHYAGLTLTGVRNGKWRKLKPSEINALRRQVKLKPVMFAK